MNEREVLASENPQDEADILTGENQNETVLLSKKLEVIEDGPESFINGEVDVKEQMDRTQEELEGPSSLGDLESSFRFTAGGLEEVEMAVDRELNHHKGEG